MKESVLHIDVKTIQFKLTCFTLFFIQTDVKGPFSGSSGVVSPLRSGCCRCSSEAFHPRHCGCERSCSRRSALMKKRSFLGNSLTSTGMASYSSLSMLKKPETPCRSLRTNIHIKEKELREESIFLKSPTSGSLSWQAPASSLVEFCVKAVGSASFLLLYNDKSMQTETFKNTLVDALNAAD